MIVNIKNVQKKTKEEIQNYKKMKYKKTKQKKRQKTFNVVLTYYDCRKKKRVPIASKLAALYKVQSLFS